VPVAAFSASYALYNSSNVRDHPKPVGHACSHYRRFQTEPDAHNMKVAIKRIDVDGRYSISKKY
jgi:hypothetical protein